MKLSGDGSQAFITDADGSLYQWHLDSAAPQMVARHFGKLLAVNQSGSQTLHAWTSGLSLRMTASGSAMRFPSVGSALDASFLSDGCFVSCGRDGSSPRLWNVFQPNAPVKICDVSTSAPRISLSPDNSKAAVADGDTLLICDLARKGVERTCRGHKQQIFGVRWAPDSSSVYTASWDGTCRGWDPVTGSPIRIFRGSTQPLSSLSVSADGRRILCGGWDGSVFVWGSADCPASVRVAHQEKTVWLPTAALACDDDVFAIGEASTRIILYDRRTGVRLTDLGNQSHTSGVQRGATATELVYGAFDGTAVIHDLAARRTVAALGQKLTAGQLAAGAELQVYCVRADNAPRALLWRREHELVAWDLAARKPIRTLATEELNWQQVISPDGRFAMAFLNHASNGLTVYSVDSAVQKSTSSDGGLDGKAAGVFSSDGELLLTRRDHREAFATIWRTSDLSPLRKVPDGDHVITSDRFWPTDQYLLSFQAMGDALLRDANTGDVLYSFHDMGIPLTGSGANYLITWQEEHHTVTVSDFTWPVRRRSLQSGSEVAMTRLAKGESRPDDLLILGKWFALHGIDDWAIEFFDRARNSGAPVDPLDMATCYARFGHAAEAAESYKQAHATAKLSLSRQAYLQYCIDHYSEDTNAVEHP